MLVGGGICGSYQRLNDGFVRFVAAVPELAPATPRGVWLREAPACRSIDSVHRRDCDSWTLIVVSIFTDERGSIGWAVFWPTRRGIDIRGAFTLT